MAAPSKKTETLVGTFLFLGLGLLATIILMFGNIWDYFKEDYEIKVNFSEASGLIKGSTVRLRGAKIGTVASKPVLMGGDMIQVALKIDVDQQIEKGSAFRIGTASLLGDKEIVIKPPEVSTGVFLSPGAVVEGRGPDGFERLQNEATNIATETKEVVREAKTALLKIEQSVDEIRKVASQLTVTLEKVNGEILSPANLTKVEDSLGNIERATSSFAEFGEDLGPVVAEVRDTIQELRETNGAIQSTVKKIDPALEKMPGAIASIERTSDSARRAFEKVQEEKGAIGALVADEELKGDMKDFVRNLKENGILRYKDEESSDDPRDRFRGRRR
jgi:phospholipid/cholesterol/gamma-HCH transport system substrate-binding protein